MLSGWKDSVPCVEYKFNVFVITLIYGFNQDK